MILMGLDISFSSHRKMYFPAALSIGSDFWRAWALSLFFFGEITGKGHDT